MLKDDLLSLAAHVAMARRAKRKLTLKEMELLVRALEDAAQRAEALEAAPLVELLVLALAGAARRAAAAPEDPPIYKHAFEPRFVGGVLPRTAVIIPFPGKRTLH